MMKQENMIVNPETWRLIAAGKNPDLTMPEDSTSWIYNTIAWHCNPEDNMTVFSSNKTRNRLDIKYSENGTMSLSGRGRLYVRAILVSVKGERRLENKPKWFMQDSHGSASRPKKHPMYKILIIVTGTDCIAVWPK